MSYTALYGRFWPETRNLVKTQFGQFLLGRGIPLIVGFQMMYYGIEDSFSNFFFLCPETLYETYIKGNRLIYL